MYNFNAEKVTCDIVAWLKDWFEKNGKGCNAIVGISGGKDSSVVAALLVKALGRERVYGVLMPNGAQPDIDAAELLCSHLNIKKIVVNIKAAVDGIYSALSADFSLSEQSRVNLPPRIRMSVLYLVSQSLNGRVANTCNLSEDYVGYATRYGDGAGDFSPISKLTVAEVKAVGRALGLPQKLVDKTPIDGLCGKTDEENLGFSYETLDKYIRLGIEPEKSIKEKIDRLNKLNEFKLKPMPCFEFNPFE